MGANNVGGLSLGTSVMCTAHACMLHITFFLLNRHSGMVDIVELFEKMEHGGVPNKSKAFWVFFTATAGHLEHKDSFLGRPFSITGLAEMSDAV